MKITRRAGGLSAGKQRGDNEGIYTGTKKHSWWVQNRQWGVGSSMGSGKAKGLICTSHGHKLRGRLLEGMEVPGRGGQRGKLGQL